MDTDAVRLRFLVVGELPLLVAVVPAVGRGPELLGALRRYGIGDIPGVLGVELPRGARVGVVLGHDELRLVDEREAAVLRAPRTEEDRTWARAARRLRGTMLVAVGQLEADADAPVAEVVRAVDQRARRGDAIGAVVGVAEDRPRLPLLVAP